MTFTLYMTFTLIYDIYRVNCIKFGQPIAILKKIIKIFAIRCHILGLKCPKFDLGCGSVTDPAAWGSLQRTHMLDIFHELSFKGKGRKERKKRGRGGEYSPLYVPNRRQRLTSILKFTDTDIFSIIYDARYT